MAILVPLKQKYLHHSVRQHQAKARTGNTHQKAFRLRNNPNPPRIRWWVKKDEQKSGKGRDGEDS